LLSRSLTSALKNQSREKSAEYREDVMHDYLNQRLDTIDDDELDSILEDTFDVEAHFRQELRSSWILLAQIFAYNEQDDYWAAARTLNGRSGGDEVPLFPIVPITEFDSQRPRTSLGI
jgi:hypothetical protein